MLIFLQERREELRTQVIEVIEFYYKLDKDNKTVFGKHKQVYDSTGHMSDKLLNPPQIMPEFNHIWHWFEDLNQARINYAGMSFAFAPIRYTEIKAYLELINTQASKDELDILRMFDSIYLEEMNEKKVP